MAAKKSRKATSKSPGAKKARKAPARKRPRAKAKAAPARGTNASAAAARMTSFSEEVGRMAEKRFGDGPCRVERVIENGHLKIRVICPPGKQC